MFHYLNCPERHWPAKICEKAVNRLYGNLIDCLDPFLIIPPMVESDILSQEEVRKILCYDMRKAAMFMISLLHRKGRDGYRVFFSALRCDQQNKSHREIGEELDQKCQGKSISEGLWTLVNIVKNVGNNVALRGVENA